jgi:hypothetical protein
MNRSFNKKIKISSIYLKEIVLIVLILVGISSHTAEAKVMNYVCWATVAGTNGGPGNWIFGQVTQANQNTAACNLLATCQTAACGSTITCEQYNPDGDSWSYFNYNPVNCPISGNTN